MNGTSFLPALVAILILVRIRKIIEKFKSTNTKSPGASKTLDVLNIKRSFIFKRLLKRGVLIETNYNRFYLDEENLITYNNRRRRIMIAVVLVMIILILVEIALMKYRF